MERATNSFGTSESEPMELLDTAVFINYLQKRDAQLLRGDSSTTRIHGIERGPSSWKVRISISWMLIWKRVKKWVEKNLFHYLGNIIVFGLNYLAVFYIYYLFYVQEKVDQEVAFLQLNAENMPIIMELSRKSYSVQG